MSWFLVVRVRAAMVFRTPIHLSRVDLDWANALNTAEAAHTCQPGTAKSDGIRTRLSESIRGRSDAERVWNSLGSAPWGYRPPSGRVTRRRSMETWRPDVASMSDWRSLLPLSRRCGEVTCDWQVSRKLNVTCARCGLGDSRASRFWRILAERAGRSD
jgi:hypothetical protein